MATGGRPDLALLLLLDFWAAFIHSLATISSIMPVKNVTMIERRIIDIFTGPTSVRKASKLL
jgi:hypothetical protein